jgi:ectoine hydroxylase-related dioxygenase (phytanoyl-CoA dioxygenase family)
MSTSLETTLEHLRTHGYAVLENVLPTAAVESLRAQCDDVAAKEQTAPFGDEVPGDTNSGSDDAAIATYLADNYSVSDAELARLMQRIRHTRATQLQTPWPVEISDVNKLFLHLPTLFDNDRSQRIWNMLNKVAAEQLMEHPIVLNIVRDVLGQDCILSDCSATSIGAHTDGGAWHVDVPLGQLPEPLPDFPLTTQNAWMLDDFTADNGATRVVPGSHLTRRKPSWKEDRAEGEITLTAPAGSVAIWLSNTWHRSGPNLTDAPRRAILVYYCRSWIKPFNDFQSGFSPEKAASFSPTLRYLLGYSATPPVRG